MKHLKPFNDTDEDIKKLAARAGVAWITQLGTNPEKKFNLRQKAKGAVAFVNQGLAGSDTLFTLRPLNDESVEIVLPKNSIFSGQVIQLHKKEVIKLGKNLGQTFKVATNPKDKYDFDYDKAHRWIKDCIEKATLPWRKSKLLNKTNDASGVFEED